MLFSEQLFLLNFIYLRLSSPFFWIFFEVWHLTHPVSEQSLILTAQPQSPVLQHEPQKTQRSRTWRGKIRDHRIAQNLGFLYFNAKAHFKSRTTITALFFFAFHLFLFQSTLQPQAELSCFSTPQIRMSARQMLSVVIDPGSREICWTLSVIDGWGTDQTWLEISSWVAVIDGSSLVTPPAQALAGRREHSVPLKGRQGRQIQPTGTGGWKRGRGCCLPPPLSHF